MQKNLKAPKNQLNKFGGYKYRSCEDILTGLKECTPEGAATTVSDDIVVVGDRFYIVATATFRFAGEEVSVKGWAREALSKKGMDDSQLTGSCSSYARKYALNGLFSIDDSKDADSGEHQKQVQPKPKAPMVGSGLRAVNSIVDAFQNEDWLLCKGVVERLDPSAKKEIWGDLSPKIQDWIKSNTPKEKK